MALTRRQWLAAQLSPVVAPSISLVSEFVRIDPWGGIAEPDRGMRPREILSPGVPRGAHLSLHLAVTMPPKESYFLYLVPNPLDACGVRLFREQFTGSIPDALVEVHRLPEFGAMPDPAARVVGQTTSVYLLDLEIPRASQLPGFRLEVQVKSGRWLIRPLEVRILPFSVPEPGATGSGAVAPVDAAARRTADLAWEEFRRGQPVRWNGKMETVRDVLRRNAVADLQLARSAAELPVVGEEAEAYLRARATLYAQRFKQGR